MKAKLVSLAAPFFRWRRLLGRRRTFTEFVLGYLLIAGVFMPTSSVFGFSEIAGHFVIRAVLLIFLLEGKGFHKPPVEMHDRVSDRVIFVTLNFLFALASFLLLCYRFG